MTNPSQDDLRLRLAGPLQRRGGVTRGRAGTWVWGVRALCLLFGFALAGCERAPDEPPPDMKLIRGEPIVPIERVDALEESAAFDRAGCGLGDG